MNLQFLQVVRYIGLWYVKINFADFIDKNLTVQSQYHQSYKKSREACQIAVKFLQKHNNTIVKRQRLQRRYTDGLNYVYKYYFK